MGVRRFMREVVTQWRSLSMEVRSVRSMLEEVLSNWERYSSTVASLQAWLEDAEEALSQPENTKRVRDYEHIIYSKGFFFCSQIKSPLIQAIYMMDSNSSE